MELPININVGDITYMSELTPTALLRKAKQWGLIRRRPTDYNLRRYLR